MADRETTLERWDLEWFGLPMPGYREMVRDDDGDWVRHQDAADELSSAAQLLRLLADACEPTQAGDT